MCAATRFAPPLPSRWSHGHLGHTWAVLLCALRATPCCCTDCTLAPLLAAAAPHPLPPAQPPRLMPSSRRGFSAAACHTLTALTAVPAVTLAGRCTFSVTAACAAAAIAHAAALGPAARAPMVRSMGDKPPACGQAPRPLLTPTWGPTAPGWPPGPAPPACPLHHHAPTDGSNHLSALTRRPVPHLEAEAAR